MIIMPEARPRSAADIPKLPPYATAEDCLADALPLLAPSARLTVTEAAERYIKVPSNGTWQNFDREVAPYMVEPADVTQSRLFTGVAMMGPSQSAKTFMLQTVAGHAVMVKPSPVLIVHMNGKSRDIWVESKLDPMIENSPSLKERLGLSRDDSTFSRKRFKGMNIYVEIPTAQILSGGTYRLVLLTDYDHHPQLLGGKDNAEGSPFGMGTNRIIEAGSSGCVLAESSPAWPVVDLSWRPSADTPHELPPTAHGIAVLYNQGTRARLYWECRDCGDEFEPRIDRLHYDADLEPAAAGASAEMECPHCGSLIGHRHKAEFNRAILRDRGGWRHEASAGRVVALDDPARRQTRIASYALNGAAAAFSKWADIVAEMEEGRRRGEAMGDWSDYARVIYTKVGLPFARPRSEDEEALTEEFLAAHAHETQKGVAPEWTRFITVSVDVQDTYFPVQVTAWGEGGRAQVVDRFDLTQPPEGAPNAERDEEGNSRRIMPPKYLADWRVLEGLAARVWHVEGRGWGLRPVACTVDFQGSPGVSDNAEAFWRGRRKAGEGKRWFLTRGHGGWRLQARHWYASPERGHDGKKARAIKLLNIATDRVKDTVAAMLTRADGGAGALVVPGWMAEEGRAEFVAEERGDKKWDLKRGVRRNEGFDLSVQARAVAEHLGMMKITDWASPPAWAAEGEANPQHVKMEAGTLPEAAPVPKPKSPPRRLF